MLSLQHRPLCHVNIGAVRLPSSALLFPRSLQHVRTDRRAVKAQTAQPGRSGNGGRQSPTSSVSDVIIDFFDDLTRGSVSFDEDDATPDDVTHSVTAATAAATAAANAAAATAGAAARAAAGAEELANAGKEWEGEALAAVTAAVAAAGSSVASLDDTSSSSSSSSSSSNSSRKEAAKSLETFAAIAQQDLTIAGTDSSSSSSKVSSGSDASKLQASTADNSSNSSSRKAVTKKAVEGADGDLQAAALSLTDVDSNTVSVGAVAGWLVKGVVGVGLLQAFKSAVEATMQQVGISSIPPAIVSMLALPLLLCALRPSIANKLVALYDGCVAPWTTDLLGLFYVPAVAVMPVLLRGMQGADLAGLLGVAALSTAATLLVAATAASAWVKISPDSSQQPPAATTPAAAGRDGRFRFTSGPAAPVLLSLSFLAAAGPLAATRFDPVRFGASMALPVGVAWSLLGYLAARVYLQQQQQQQEKEENGRKAGWLVLSPLLAGAVAANVGVAWHGRIMGWSYLVALSRYYAGDVLGAGDVLVAPLGAALTALGLLIYKHWKALALPGIAATAVVSAAFSVATSVLAAKLLGVSTDWARALIPRSVTSSTASHLAQALGAPSECTGLVVLLQAAFTVALGTSILKAVRKGGKALGPAAAGTAVGVTAGMMGVSGVCGADGVAVANGALAWACVVVVGSVMSGVPSIAAALTALVA